jgi:trk system potassium uptake protein TrkH
LIAAAETKQIGLGDVRRVIVGVVKASLLFEALTAVLLTARFALGYDVGLVRAIELGGFHAVSAFNNAGFALFSDNLIGFAGDPWICLPIAAAVIIGGIGFPVLLELRQRLLRPRRWSLHTKLTIGMTVLLLISSTVFLTLAEWGTRELSASSSRATACCPGSSTQPCCARPASTASIPDNSTRAPSWALTC